ncbi:cyclic GMP-AMP synthase DncV-like nucleotidyltransferase [Methylobacterium goesingense]|uniref:Cyclic GMP-AMP synthase n=1 Tax=Methylobacterium goesingense TaxID=243690 RepID=A0ABV2L8N8_9HYPH|nr:hypothetical protein [Methylobacterium goesingense]GJD76524.1 hypothetical protein CFIICLFH_4782 [Methylobacterium goesingense]
MYDCSDDVLGYHGAEVTLPDTERKTMRQRRDTNRQRLRDGLARDEKPAVEEFAAQGSYAMRTMLRHPTNDYDIDDGAYFSKGLLVGSRGGEMSPREAKEMVRDAVDHGFFATKPEVRKNCVRIIYAAGYHVDMPVYRRVITKDWTGKEEQHYELAASAGWKRSDARNVTKWFDDERRKSGDAVQVRRIVRLVKKFARSRESWGSQILSGFGITKLVTEKYQCHSERHDKALYYTMQSIRDRLNASERVDHPTTPNETITSHPEGSYWNDPKSAFLRDKLTDALTKMERLFAPDCTRKEALQCWDKVFGTAYFIGRYQETSETKPSSSTGLSSPSVLSSTLLIGQGTAASGAVRKEGGERHA